MAVAAGKFGGPVVSGTGPWQDLDIGLRGLGPLLSPVVHSHTFEK